MDSKLAPHRYDGIYKVVKYWQAKGKSGFKVWRYLLRRDDPIPAPWTKEGEKRTQQLGLVMQVRSLPKKLPSPLPKSVALPLPS